MKLYAELPQPSRGLDRIRSALIRYCPDDVEFVKDEAAADVVVIYAIGRHDAIERRLREILSRGQRYAVIQVCLRSTMTPNSRNWRGLWFDAKVVWSYYDLNRILNEDDYPNDGTLWYLDNFYHAPLGVDAEVFQVHPKWKTKDYVILSSGQSRLSESVRECHLAAEAVGKHSAHLGSLRLSDVDCYSGMPDDVLRGLYNNCEFVSGLRRTEGFELPAAEGLLCGARPIVFDSEDYRFNYKDFAEYIHEGTRAEVVEQLVELFKRGARPVTAEEREQAAEWFDWKRIIGGFYERLA